MKTLIMTAALLLGTAAAAETPNRTGMGWKEYVEASGCVFVDMGGYSTLALASDPSDPCPAKVINSFWGVGSLMSDGPDGLPGTADDGRNKPDN
jgi:hypothetical protein